MCLVASKSKVAPLQSISIPHLELMGAVLGTRLAQTIVRSCYDNGEEFYYFLD